MQLFGKSRNDIYQMITDDSFLIFAANIDCKSSLEETSQTMRLSQNKKNNEYPCTPYFVLYKVEFSRLPWLRNFNAYIDCAHGKQQSLWWA